MLVDAAAGDAAAAPAGDMPADAGAPAGSEEVLELAGDMVVEDAGAPPVTSGVDAGTSGSLDSGASGFESGASGFDTSGSGLDAGTSGTSGFESSGSGFESSASGFESSTSGSYDQASAGGGDSFELTEEMVVDQQNAEPAPASAEELALLEEIVMEEGDSSKNTGNG
jgi:hypothetical protein